MSGTIGPTHAQIMAWHLHGNWRSDRPYLQAAADFLMDETNTKEDLVDVVLNFFADKVRKAYDI